MRTFERIRPSATLRSSAVALVLVLSGQACAPTSDASDTTGASAPPRGGSTPPTGDTVRIAREISEDLTGDGRPEHLTLDARGPGIDSLRVRLEIRSAGDSLLLASSWTSEFYFQYVDRAEMTDAAADSTVRKHIDAVLTDSAFRNGVAGTVSDTMMLGMMRDAIRYDIATHQWRTENSLAPGDDLPPTSHEPINTLARAVPRSRIDALVTELRGRKTFTWFAGGEVTYVIAWSDREQRFVTVFSCC